MPGKVVVVSMLEPFKSICGKIYPVWRAEDRSASYAHLVMQPGDQTTLHHHNRTTEHYMFQSGQGILTLDGERHEVMAGMVAEIPAGTKHHLECTGDKPMNLGVLANPAFDPVDEVVDE